MTLVITQTRIIDKITFFEEVIPYIRKYGGETFVIYYDGSALYDKELAMKFAHDIVLMRQLGINIIIIHGGQKIIDEMHSKMNVNSTYVNNTRVTDSNSIELVEMASGLIGKRIVTNINDAGGSAVSISGKDANLMEAKKYRSAKARPNSNVKNIIDLGFVGEPTGINPDVLFAFEDTEFILVISAIAAGENGETFQVNPLTASGLISSVLVVKKFIIINDCEDLIIRLGGRGATTNYKAISGAVADIARHDDLLHYIKLCASVLENKVGSISIVDGKIPHALLLDLFTDDKQGVSIENELNNF